MSNTIKVNPEMTRPNLARSIHGESVHRIASLITHAMFEQPQLFRSTNSHEVLAPLKPVAEASFNTPSPLESPYGVPPRLTREDEKRKVTPAELDEAARKSW